jgi:hypothetical protein
MPIPGGPITGPEPPPRSGVNKVVVVALVLGVIALVVAGLLIALL